MESAAATAARGQHESGALVKCQAAVEVAQVDLFPLASRADE